MRDGERVPNLPRRFASRMSHKTVQWLIGRLLTDEEFRTSFLDDPATLLAMVVGQGFELTPAEVEALLRTERSMWSDAAARIDPHLQKIRLR